MLTLAQTQHRRLATVKSNSSARMSLSRILNDAPVEPIVAPSRIADAAFAAESSRRASPTPSAASVAPVRWDKTSPTVPPVTNGVSGKHASPPPLRARERDYEPSPPPDAEVALENDLAEPAPSVASATEWHNDVASEVGEPSVPLEVGEQEVPRVSGTGRARRRAAAAMYKEEPHAYAPTPESNSRKRKKVSTNEPKRVRMRGRKDR